MTHQMSPALRSHSFLSIETEAFVGNPAYCTSMSPEPVRSL